MSVTEMLRLLVNTKTIDGYYIKNVIEYIEIEEDCRVTFLAEAKDVPDDVITIKLPIKELANYFNSYLGDTECYINNIRFSRELDVCLVSFNCEGDRHDVTGSSLLESYTKVIEVVENG